MTAGNLSARYLLARLGMRNRVCNGVETFIFYLNESHNYARWYSEDVRLRAKIETVKANCQTIFLAESLNYPKSIKTMF